MSQTPDHHGVTDQEIASAMGVNSVPDDVRLHADGDETDQVIDATGQLTTPAEEH